VFQNQRPTLFHIKNRKAHGRQFLVGRSESGSCCLQQSQGPTRPHRHCPAVVFSLQANKQRKLVQTLLATVMASLRQDSTAIDMISRTETTSALPALSRGVLQKRKDAARQSLRLRRLQS